MPPPAGLTRLHRRECRRSWAAGGGRSGSRGEGSFVPVALIASCCFPCPPFLAFPCFLALLSPSFLVSLPSFPRRSWPLAPAPCEGRRGLAKSRAHTHNTGDAKSRSRPDRPGPGRVLSGVPRTCRASAPLAAGCRCLRSDSRRGREEVGGAAQGRWGKGEERAGGKEGWDGRTDGGVCEAVSRQRRPTG